VRRRLDAVLLLDKPPGLSSNAALQIARRIFRAAKAGHGGTLDPLASGLLPVLFGDATKFSGLMLDAGKVYRATLALGQRTDTGDAEGKVISTRRPDFSDAALESALDSLRGEIQQVPPMHSALKKDGKPLYLLARQGIEVVRQPRRVLIERLELLGRTATTLDIEVACSKGTYIRTLADDLGEKLDCGAHLTALRRTVVGALSVDAAWGLEKLEAASDEDRDRMLLPVDRLLAGFVEVRLDASTAARFGHGQAVTTADAGPGPRRVYGETGRFLGLGEVDASGTMRPLRLVADVAQPADNH